mmetsp:Transcript_15937/g.65239  ORF Transcript_15937/g.65239 Transcript_15937/m.65239 type:complete len:216 (-) Transcript_15937:4475-5122(-)
MIRAGAAGKILETPRLSFVNGYHVRLVTQRTRACDRQRACKVKSSAVVEGEEQRMLRFFADSVKTVTLAAACTSIAVKRDASMIVYFIGALGISILVKTLKMIINESRPTDKKKSSSGMPSSHATVLCFLSAYLVWTTHQGVERRQMAHEHSHSSLPSGPGFGYLECKQPRPFCIDRVAAYDCRWIHRKGRRWIPYMGSGSRWRGPGVSRWSWMA